MNVFLDEPAVHRNERVLSPEAVYFAELGVKSDGSMIERGSRIKADHLGVPGFRIA
ncbi:hypothetical protein D3C73_1580170 [compost metagenome]